MALVLLPVVLSPGARLPGDRYFRTGTVVSRKATNHARRATTLATLGTSSPIRERVQARERRDERQRVAGDAGPPSVADSPVAAPPACWAGLRSRPGSGRPRREPAAARAGVGVPLRCSGRVRLDP